ncbi:MAG: outer rane immunogenic protein [Verrucomicrobiota bacterium]
MPVVETCCFDGWYFGIHGGVVLPNLDMNTNVDEESLGAAGNGFVSASDHHGSDDTASWQGGLHAGYNWCRGGWVFGPEVDLSATGIDESHTVLAIVDLENGPPFGTEMRSRTEIDWYSTMRLRFGHTLGNRVFLYVTGGLAIADAETRSQSSLFASTSEGGATFANDVTNDNGIKFGWTAGAGMDFCLSQHVILNFTYLYTDLEDNNGTSEFHETSGPVESGVRTYDALAHTSSKNNFHVLQAGLSFKF